MNHIARWMGAAAIALLGGISVASAAWNVEWVDQRPFTGGAASLGINPATGQLTIAYNRWLGANFPTFFEPFAALKFGNSWSKEQLDLALENVSRATSVSFNDVGNAAVTYSYGSTIRFVTRGGLSWNTPEVVSNAGGAWSSLVMQGSSPLVTFYDGAGADLELATRPADTFVTQTLDGNDAGVSCSLAQRDAFMLVGYIRGGKLAVRISFNSGGTWGEDMTFPTTIDAAYCAVDVAAATKGDLLQPRGHIFFYDAVTGTYRYVNEDTDTGVWTTPETVATVGSALEGLHGLSIAVDSTGRPHVAFFDYGTRTLKYSVRGASGWSTPQTVDSALGGASCSLALASGDLPRIAYAALVNNGGTLNLAGLRLASFTNVPPAPPAPTLTVAGKPRIVTRAARLSVSGSATNASTVRWRVGNGAFRTATVTNGRWKVSAGPLRVGRSVLSFRAVGPGGTSAERKIIVTRR